MLSMYIVLLVSKVFGLLGDLRSILSWINECFAALQRNQFWQAVFCQVMYLILLQVEHFNIECIECTSVAHAGFNCTKCTCLSWTLHNVHGNECCMQKCRNEATIYCVRMNGVFSRNLRNYPRHTTEIKHWLLMSSVHQGKNGHFLHVELDI